MIDLTYKVVASDSNKLLRRSIAHTPKAGPQGEHQEGHRLPDAACLPGSLSTRGTPARLTKPKSTEGMTMQQRNGR